MKKVTVLVCSLAITVVLGLAACEPGRYPVLCAGHIPAPRFLRNLRCHPPPLWWFREPEETASSATSEVGVNPGEIVDGYSYSIKRTPS